MFAGFSRAFWQPDVSGRIAGGLTFDEGHFDPQALERFRALADLNVSRLRQQVRVCLLTEDAVLLSQVLRRFPPRDGILEVAGYLVVAIQDSQHYIADDQLVDVEVAAADGPELWRVPEVLFTRDQ